MTTTLKGIVAEITFQNDDNGYTVLQLSTSDSPKPCTCTGAMPTIAAGESVLLHGAWTNHRRFGAQFEVERYEIVRPTTKEGIALLLGSGLVAGIGPVRAEQIVQCFGLATLDVLDNDPGRLGEVRGIGAKTLEKIKDAWQRQRHIRDLMLFLQEIGVSVGLAARIYKVYGPQAREKISGDPYALLDDVWGVGFVKADAVAQKMGFTHDSYKRIRAGIAYMLADAASGNGHSFLPADALVHNAAVLLGVNDELVVFALDHAAQAGLVVREEDRVYLPRYFHAENYVAKRLLEKIDAAEGKTTGPSVTVIEKWLDDYRRANGWQGDPKQLSAVSMALTNPLFLLTGGPGTGKTTILQVIVSYLRGERRAIVLAAPTGRAAQRMGTLAGLRAQTIHRLLEFRGGASGYAFNRNEANPIEADVLIIDEMSMIDIVLMRNLLAAVKPATALVFVGDSNQLPSVGAGNVLADLIAGECIPHVNLTTVFRQAASSRIVTAAHEIIGGTVPVFTNAQSDNCFFVAEDEPERCAQTIVDLVARRLPARYHLDPVGDIQVLSPMHKGPLGTQNLSLLLQRELNASTRKITRGATSFFTGDKVLQLRNNYDLGVYNGDIGIIKEIDEDSGLSVDFDGMEVRYDVKDLDELAPAYCMSIHKSQGSEFKAVVIPLSTQHYILLQRNLLYTGITRARELCVLVGTHKALSIAVKNNQAIERYSHLGKRLRISGSVTLNF
jgi:exodeoxyribonuclease V alpha subunit